MKHISDSKVVKIAKLTHLSDEAVENDWLYYDWDNLEEHEKWIQEASVEEIVEWILTCDASGAGDRES